MTPDEIQRRLERVNELQELVTMLLDKAEETTTVIENELMALHTALDTTIEAFKHTPEPVKHFSNEDLERLMS